jgi:hypothetical protein
LDEGPTRWPRIAGIVFAPSVIAPTARSDVAERPSIAWPLPSIASVAGMSIATSAAMQDDSFEVSTLLVVEVAALLVLVLMLLADLGA